MVMLLIIIWMGWRLIPSSCNFLASDDVQAALSLLTPHHDRLPPPRVPDHRVEWTRGRSPSIPSQPQVPQWAPRPPQRRTSQAGFPSVRLSRCRPVLGFKPFLLLLKAFPSTNFLGSFLFSLVCACQSLSVLLLPGWLSIIMCMGQNVFHTHIEL